mmetsp:Transcript_24402/g.76528  ORF Transcript_24402/g.76528 Transcript_24402/m.76528 type:complete len:231 (-) Transcript_24402:276-968(-)
MPQFTVNEHAVGHAASLRALATVGRAPPPGFGTEALPRIRNAQCAVHEHLHLDVRRGRRDLLNLANAKLPREHHARNPELLRRKLDALRARNAHLRRRVDGHVRRDLVCEPRQADVLNDEGINPGFCSVAHGPLGLRELLLKNENIEREVPPDAVLVQVRHDIRQLVIAEVVRAGARVEPGPGGIVRLQPEIHGVAAIGHGCAELVPAAGGGEHLRALERRQRALGCIGP